jgi:hypothetical protein
MDWGLGNPSCGFLRERLLFRNRSAYWVVRVCRILDHWSSYPFIQDSCVRRQWRLNDCPLSICAFPQAIFTDLSLRFLWTFSLIPAASLPVWVARYMDYWMVAFLESAELFRRAMWGCLRSVRARALTSTRRAVSLTSILVCCTGWSGNRS